ncbi:P-loop ATPase, Sll1717 family [Rhodococcus sp. IEGM 1318]|uniref:P-loop ATPase, Sll1717 family n=1 Tax=Rhodococcus sp. IEGM 1318 TaxID=3082226 RepID=UPI002954FB2D|nr:hypothetical protein [Rhodococcus sp. IEGM 1318]MDV8004452.1 hypothetical protein [Rhodococcus sp. IEGM 1318]
MIQQRISLGKDQAEHDPLLDPAFVETGDYDLIASFDEVECIVVGRTGSGKSAILTRLAMAEPDRVIHLNPQDLALTYILDQQVFHFLRNLDIDLNLFWTTLWKHVLVVEVIRKRYRIEDQSAMRRFLDSLKEKLSRDRSKIKALEYLETYEDKFWEETDERIIHYTNRLSETVQVEAGGSFSFGQVGIQAKAGEESMLETEESGERNARFKRIINTDQHAQLRKMINVLQSDILDTHNERIYVVIDDLDLNWIDEPLVHDMIRALFTAIRDLKSVQFLKVVVALRTNLLHEIEQSTRDWQVEKYDSLQHTIRWSRANLEVVLDSRTNLAMKKYGVDVDSFSDLMPIENYQNVSGVDYILDRTLLRPRDAIRFANECLVVGAGKSRIDWGDIVTAEASYSDGRLRALTDEWSTTYPNFAIVLTAFSNAATKFTKDDFEEKLGLVVGDVLSSNPSMPNWFNSATELLYAPGERTFAKNYGALIRILFRVGFIGAQVSPDSSVVYSYDESNYCKRDERLQGMFYFHIHPAFHRALDLPSS